MRETERESKRKEREERKASAKQAIRKRGGGAASVFGKSEAAGKRTNLPGEGK